MGSSSTADFIGGFFHVVGTTISKKSRSVLLDLKGVPDVLAPDDDTKGELAPQQLAYGPLGLIVNPLDRGVLKDGRTPAQADLYGIRMGDIVLPVVGFDPRIDAAFPNGPAKGTVALAGYAGGFHSIDLTNNGDSNIHVIYAPYDSDGPKAHAIIVDTTSGNENITVVHSGGHSFILTKDGKAIVRSPSGSVSLQVSDDGHVLFGNTIIAGGATIGSPTGALPAAIAQFVATALNAINSGVTAALGAITPAGGGPAAVSAYSTATSGLAAAISSIPAVNTSIF